MTSKNHNSEPDAFEDFSANSNKIHEIRAPSQTIELTPEDVVFLKEFFEELEVEDAQEE